MQGMVEVKVAGAHVESPLLELKWGEEEKQLVFTIMLQLSNSEITKECVCPRGWVCPNIVG